MSLLQGIGLGLGAAAPIGPVNVEIARRSIRGGFLCGMLLGCGAVTVDMTYAALVSLGLRLVVIPPPVQLILGIAGASLLAYLAVLSLKSARQVKRENPAEGETPSPAAPSSAKSDRPVGNYVTGLLMTALNPMTLAFWFISVPSVAAGVESATRPGGLPLLCMGVAVGAFSWVLFFASLMSAAGRLSRRYAMLWADVIGGVMLLSFALYVIWRIAKPYL